MKSPLCPAADLDERGPGNDQRVAPLISPLLRERAGVRGNRARRLAHVGAHGAGRTA